MTPFFRGSLAYTLVTALSAGTLSASPLPQEAKKASPESPVLAIQHDPLPCVTTEIRPEVDAALVPIVSRARISLFAELNVLLYLGVLAFAGGLAWTASAYSDTWGDFAILVPATALLVGCFAWCTRHVPPLHR